MRLAVIAIALLAVLTAGCGGSGSGEEEPGAAPATQAGTTDDMSPSATTGLVETDAATGGSSTGGQPPAAGPEQLPATAQPLEPGEYATSIFAPAFSFVVDQPVATGGPELPNAVALDLGMRGESTLLTLINDSMMLFDPESEHAGGTPDLEAAEVTSPDSLITWLAEHPRLEVSVPEEVTIGGVPAIEVTVEIAQGEGYEAPTACNPGIECVLLLGTPQFDYFAEVDSPIRFQVLKPRVERSPS
jgi:hypothetical protein